MQEETRIIEDILRRSVRGPAWHGPALLEAATEAKPEDAYRRTAPGVHSIWEILSHSITWIRVVRLRLIGQRTGAIPPVEDWPSSEPPKTDWEGTLRILGAETEQLQQVIASLSNQALDRMIAGEPSTVRETLLGLIQHNTYHAGQIALLSRHWRECPALNTGGSR